MFRSPEIARFHVEARMRSGLLPALVAGVPLILLWFANLATGALGPWDGAFLVVHVAILLAAVLGIVGAAIRFAEVCVVAAFVLLAAGIPLLGTYACPVAWAPAAGFLLAARWTPGYQGAAGLLAKSVGTMAGVAAGLVLAAAVWRLLDGASAFDPAEFAWSGLLAVTLLMSTLAAWSPEPPAHATPVVMAPRTA